MIKIPVIFEIKGVLNGKEISPRTLDIREVHEFLGEIRDFIMADKNIPKHGVEIPIQYVEGSARFIAELPEHFARPIEEDLKRLEDDELDNFSFTVPKRAEVIQKWLRRCVKNPGIQYGIGVNRNTERLIFIDQNTRLANLTETTYDSELYLYGKIMAWGGVSTSNIHIKTEEYGTVIVNIPHELLAREESNRVYKEGGIRVKATQNLLTGEVLEAAFVEFLDYQPGNNLKQLSKAIEIGSKKWKDVPSSAEWVRDLRGEL